MEYLLLLHDDEKRWDVMPEDQFGREMGAYAAHTTAVRDYLGRRAALLA